MEATYFKFGNVSYRLWGWTRFPRASGASEQRSQLPSYTYTLYCLAYISWYYLILSAISDITLHCTMWKYYYWCETIDKLQTFVSRQFDKDFQLLGLVRIFQCPHVPTGWFVTHLYASLARRARSKTGAKPKTNPSCVRHSIWRRLISNLGTCRIGCEVGLDFHERAERASNDLNFQATHIPYIACIYFVVLPNFVSNFEHHIALCYVEIVLFMWNYS